MYSAQNIATLTMTHPIRGVSLFLKNNFERISYVHIISFSSPKRGNFSNIYSAVVTGSLSFDGYSHSLTSVPADIAAVPAKSVHLRAKDIRHPPVVCMQMYDETVAAPVIIANVLSCGRIRQAEVWQI